MQGRRYILEAVSEGISAQDGPSTRLIRRTRFGLVPQRTLCSSADLPIPFRPAVSSRMEGRSHGRVAAPGQQSTLKEKSPDDPPPASRSRWEAHDFCEPLGPHERLERGGATPCFVIRERQNNGATSWQQPRSSSRGCIAIGRRQCPSAASQTKSAFPPGEAWPRRSATWMDRKPGAGDADLVGKATAPRLCSYPHAIQSPSSRHSRPSRCS